MYKTIAVDDEILALKRFAHIITKEERIELNASFTDPLEALDYIKNNTVDIAFLDIEMPELNGLQLAERINEIDPHVSIIFITAFDHYALEAFRAHAIGYLLKPLDIREFSIQIDNIAINKAPRGDKSNELIDSNVKLKVNCLGQFVCYASDHPDEPITFRTAKTAELFAFLIHNYKSPIAKNHILDSLFPDADYEKSTKLFYVSCSYLRNAFAKYNIVDVLLRDNDSYRINTSIIDCDYINFMNSYEHLTELSIDELKKTTELYNGEYLLGRSYEWAFELKPYIDNLNETMLIKLSDLLEASGNTEEAISLLQRLITLDPLRENIVKKLMTLLVDSKQREKAIAVYKVYETKLMEQLDTIPSSSLRAIIS